MKKPNEKDPENEQIGTFLVYDGTFMGRTKGTSIKL
jgi:hypothetical protein